MANSASDIKVRPNVLEDWKQIPLSSALLALALASGSLGAGIPEHLRETRTIDFTNSAGMGYTQHGYRITGPGLSWARLYSGGGVSATNGGTYLQISSAEAPVTLEQADGTSFDLISMDLAEYSTYAIPDVVTIQGTKADGSSLTFNHVIDRIIDGDGPVNDFETVQLPPGWTDLTRVQFVTTGVALDNIKVRGLRLENFGATHGNQRPIELMAILDGSGDDTWGVTGQVDGKLVLRHQRYSYDPVYWTLFDTATGHIGERFSQSSTSGGNIITGEIAFVNDGELTWQHGSQSTILARVGENGVTRISHPAPADGKVMFVNPWYEGRQKYAVFLAGPEGVEPVITPQTILPDGGVPHSFPDAIHFNGNSFAIPTSTSVSGARFVVSFGGGPLRLSPGHGDTIPGTSLKIYGRPEFRWLDDTSAGFIAVSDGVNEKEFHLVLQPDGSWTASPRNLPSWGARTILAGYGFVQRQQGAVDFIHNPTLVIYGPVECADLAENNFYGLVARTESGSQHLMLREGWSFADFGTVQTTYEQAYVEDGWFYACASNVDGQVGLFRSRIPEAVPRLQVASFIPQPDGTVRFMVENLTYNRGYRVERSSSPSGPWMPVSRFTAGSPARSVLGNFQYGSSEFFRVAEMD